MQSPENAAAYWDAYTGSRQGLCVLEIGEKYTKVGAWRHEDGAYIEGYVPTKLLKIVRPYEHYGVVVDKPLQELRVYEYGRLVGRMRISTGLMEKNELARETRREHLSRRTG